MEILFRAKKAILTDGKYKASKEWVYGYYFYNPNTKYPHYIKEQDSGMEYKVIGETVGQLLGVDKNGNNIFEGDIVKKIKNQKGDLTRQSWIIRNFNDYIGDNILRKDKLINEWTKLIQEQRFLEVIGNIYNEYE